MFKISFSNIFIMDADFAGLCENLRATGKRARGSRIEKKSRDRDGRGLGNLPGGLKDTMTNVKGSRKIRID